MAFAKKKRYDDTRSVHIGSCCVGSVVPLDDKRLGITLGSGFCVEPADSEFCCPVSGVVKDIAAGGTSVTFKTAEGLIVITSLICRDGGRPPVKVCQNINDSVSRGEPLWESSAPPESLTAMIVVTNCAEDNYSVKYGELISLTDDVMTVNITN